MEVALARVYNWDVVQRRKEKSEGDGKEGGKAREMPGRVFAYLLLVPAQRLVGLDQLALVLGVRDLEHGHAVNGGHGAVGFRAHNEKFKSTSTRWVSNKTVSRGGEG